MKQEYENGKIKVIEHLDFIIEDKPNKGQFVVILGPSGCGKSTLLRYIAGLQTPTAGTINILGKPRTEEDRIGMVFQKYSSLPWLSVLDNCKLGLKFQNTNDKEATARAMEMLKLVELEQHSHKYAQYPTLSGGQLQRVAIARSLLANSKILLMDEPFGALDVKTRLRMQDLVLKIWKDLTIKGDDPTVVFVTHDISEAVYLADEIVILSKAPAYVSERIIVPFGERNRELKHTEDFKNLVMYIEEKMQQA